MDSKYIFYTYIIKPDGSLNYVSSYFHLRLQRTVLYKYINVFQCTCRDPYCQQMKTRVEVCRPLVIEASKNDTVVSCELAQWICMVDPVCSSALDYYHTYCKRVLNGAPCTERCLNSVEILRRQEKAHKMNRCRCAGQTAVQCLHEKERMVRLCYGGDSDTRVQQVGGGGGNKSGGGGRKYRKKHRSRMFDMDPDRAEVEMMMANPDYQPDGRNRYNATVGLGGDGANGSVPTVRASPAGVVLCALYAAAAILVTRSSLFCG